MDKRVESFLENIQGIFKKKSDIIIDQLKEYTRYI
jgi:hypothetical protein